MDKIQGIFLVILILYTTLLLYVIYIERRLRKIER